MTKPWKCHQMLQRFQEHFETLHLEAQEDTHTIIQRWGLFQDVRQQPFSRACFQPMPSRGGRGHNFSLVPRDFCSNYSLLPQTEITLHQPIVPAWRSTGQHTVTRSRTSAATAQRKVHRDLRESPTSVEFGSSQNGLSNGYVWWNCAICIVLALHVF